MLVLRNDWVEAREFVCLIEVWIFEELHETFEANYIIIIVNKYMWL
jgi:hypothetical protein